MQYGNCPRETVLAGSFPDGASWCEALDMAGNVWEWVNDWYDGDYYDVSPARNPPGPQGGEYKVLRGGSWINIDYYVRSAYRNGYAPVITFSRRLGFRCVGGSTSSP